MAEKRCWLPALICGLLSLFSFSLVFSGEAGAWPSFCLPEPAFLLLSAMLVPLTLRKNGMCLRAAGLGFLFGCFTLIGRAFFDHDWDYFLLRHDLPHLLSYALALPGFAVCWAVSVNAVFCLLDRKSERIAATEESPMDRYPFVLPFVLLTAIHLPSMVLCWPGIATPGDTVAQLQMLGEGAVLSNHHPVVHTLLLGFFLRLGVRFFSSASAGLGCFTILQAVFSLACFSLAIKRLGQRGVSPGIRLLVTLYLGFSPGISNMLMTTTKDVFYAAFLLLFFLCLESRLHGAVNLPALCGSALGVLVFRSEGKYICFIALLLSLMLVHGKEGKRYFGAAMLFVAAASLLYSRIFLPAVHAEPGSIREALSVPFQQTARYFVGHEDEVTEEERKRIDAVLDTSRIVEFYKPNTVDGIKFPTFLITGEQAAAYLVTWAEMGLRHPVTYMDAFLELNNQYLYRTQRSVPFSKRSNTYSSANSRYAWESVAEMPGFEIGYPEALDPARERFESFRTGLFGVPGIRLLCFPATFVWLSIASAVYFAGKNRSAFALSLIPMLIVLFFFLGPTDGTSFRYAYPVAVLWPFSFLLAYHRIAKTPLETHDGVVYNKKKIVAAGWGAGKEKP